MVKEVEELVFIWLIEVIFSFFNMKCFILLKQFQFFLNIDILEEGGMVLFVFWGRIFFCLYFLILFINIYLIIICGV